MKRLTARSDNGDAYFPHCLREDTCDGEGNSEKCNSCKFNDKICERLAAYEDTGLSPKQIRKMEEHMDGNYRSKKSGRML